MKVLWFTHMPSNASSYLNYKSDRCGWVSSLENELSKKNNIDLAVAFYHKHKEKPFTIGKVKYYPIYSGLENKIKKWLFKYNGGLESEKDIKKYIDVINDFNPDIIHIHGTESAFGLIIPYIKIPVVISIQGNLTVCNHKFFSGLQKSDLYKNCSFKDILQIKHFLFSKNSYEKKSERERKILGYTNHVIGRTDWDRRITRILAPNASYYFNDEMLRNSFYQNNWQPNESGNKVIFSTIGDNPYKGLETIWGSIELLNKSENIIWKVAGVDENSQITRILKSKFKEKVPKNLILLGSVNEKELVEELLNSDLYIHPSHIENSPNSVCEAMILGLPIIATFAGGTNSLFTDKKEGILIQDGDPFSMAGAIKEIFNNYAKAILYGELARKRALNRHNKTKILNELIAIYEKIQNRKFI